MLSKPRDAASGRQRDPVDLQERDAAGRRPTLLSILLGSGAVDASDLLEIHAIERLKYKYLRCLDQKLWDDLETCFTEDATASYGGGAYELDGRAAIMEFLRSAMGSTTMLSSHKCHHPEIDLLGPARRPACGRSRTWSSRPAAQFTVRGAAWYTDRYVKGDDGGWRIAHTGYKRTYEELQSRADVPGLTLTADWWATGGRSKLG